MSGNKTTRYHLRRREFLNEDPEFPAYIIGIVEDTREIFDEDVQAWTWGTVQLELGDCYRRVSFDFSLSDPQERAASLKKITLIAEVVNALRDAIAIESESRNRRPHIQDQTEAAVA